jgi:hypothetical protein
MIDIDPFETGGNPCLDRQGKNARSIGKMGKHDFGPGEEAVRQHDQFVVGRISGSSACAEVMT